MRNPYRRFGARPPASCVSRGLARDALDALVARRGTPARPGDANPWPKALSKVEVGAHALHHDKATPLALVLLHFGGASALNRSSSEDAEAIASRGQLWPATESQLLPGRTSACHDNACLLWAARQDTLVLATGYCLDDDGLWRQHSWCVDVSGPRPTIVETTQRRLLYFGFALDAEESIAMCRSQLGWSPRLARAPLRVPDGDEPSPGPRP